MTSAEQPENTWTEVRAVVLGQHRTLRTIAEAVREVAKATLRGDELGIAVMPYAVLVLDRAIQMQFRQEESLVCPLLENDLAAGVASAEQLRTRHLHLLREMESLANGGAQQAVHVARRLHAVTSTLLAEMREQEESLWA